MQNQIDMPIINDNPSEAELDDLMSKLSTMNDDMEYKYRNSSIN